MNPELVIGSVKTDRNRTRRRLAPAPTKKSLKLDLSAMSMTQLSWRSKPTAAVWTKAEYASLCRHLHNNNPPTHFVMGFRDKDGCKRYVRSKKLSVERAISWSWQSVAGAPKARLAFVPYSQDQQGQSRWGGMDFDAHHGESDRARQLAFAAFRVILNIPDLAVILETSGSGGWHVWAISQEFHAVEEWARLLSNVAATIGATITSGVCEIFPHSATSMRFGKGMRAPGSWNPGTDQCNQIVWENIRTSHEVVLSGKSKNDSLISNDLESHFPDRERSFLSLSPYRATELLKKLGITLSCTRNQKLAELVGEVFHQVGHEMARRLSQVQFQQKTVATRATEAEHLESFEALWLGLVGKWSAALTAEERNIYEQLLTEKERDAFRIIRSYARQAKADALVDFPIARDNLAQRLGLSGKGAAGIRDKLTKLGAIAKTADYVPNKSSMRFKWIADAEIKNPF